jgi:hypothetical protein
MLLHFCEAGKFHPTYFTCTGINVAIFHNLFVRFNLDKPF